MSTPPPGDAPDCPAPPATQRAARRFSVPAGAIDTHAHVIGAPPYSARRSYTPAPAPMASYIAMLDATGMKHGVLIQVSVHGTDNGVMLAALRAHPRRLKGIAVIPLGLSDRELRELKDANVVGLRLNVLYGGGIGFEQLAAYGALCRELGWHLQFLIDARDLVPLAPQLARLPVPFVVDHMGHFPTSRGLADPGFQTLVALVRDGGWVKLSGAYRDSVTGPPYADTIPFARALVQAGANRCVWGSDWPHVSHWGPMMQVGDLLDLLADWVPDSATRNRVLVDNPRRLYGFAA